MGKIYSFPAQNLKAGSCKVTEVAATADLEASMDWREDGEALKAFLSFRPLFIIEEVNRIVEDEKTCRVVVDLLGSVRKINLLGKVPVPVVSGALRATALEGEYGNYALILWAIRDADFLWKDIRTQKDIPLATLPQALEGMIHSYNYCAARIVLEAARIVPHWKATLIDFSGGYDIPEPFREMAAEMLGERISPHPARRDPLFESAYRPRLHAVS